MQIVFQIQIPIEWMSECEFKENKMRSITLNNSDSGTVLIQVIHIPNKKRELLHENDIPNFLGFFCNRKFAVTWILKKELFLKSYHTCKHVEFGDIKYVNDTRAVTIGYSKDKKQGFFLDTFFEKSE